MRIKVRSEEDGHPELHRLLGAARGYSGESVEHIAEGIGMSHQTLWRIIRGHRPARQHELDAIADHCGVPRAFFEVGFGPMFEVDIEETKARLRALKAAA